MRVEEYSHSRKKKKQEKEKIVWMIGVACEWMNGSARFMVSLLLFV